LKSSILKVPDREKYLMIVIPKSGELDLKKLKAITGYEINLLNNEQIEKVTKCIANALPPFGSIWNMNTYIDKTI